MVHPDLQMLHRGDPRSDHLEGRIEGVEVGIDGASGDPRREPELERVIARTELDRRQADVVMAVDQARDDDIIGRADDLVGLVLLRYLVMGADVDDHAVALEDRAVLDDRRLVTVDDAADDVFPTN